MAEWSVFSPHGPYGTCARVGTMARVRRAAGGMEAHVLGYIPNEFVVGNGESIVVLRVEAGIV